MNRNNILNVLALLLAIILLPSCAGTLDPELKTMQVNVRPVNPTVNIRPSSAKDMTVFLRFRNTSGADMDIRDALYREIEDRGYRTTRNLDEASYVLIADLRYVGQTSHKTYGATIFGALVGALAGGIIGNNIGGDNSNNTAIGAGVGAVAGGIGGEIIGNRNKLISIDMVVDISIGERVNGGVTTSRKSSSSSNNSSSVRSNSKNGLHEAGTHRSQYSESTDFKQQEDFFYRENRFIATAKKIGLTFQEASPAMSRRLTRSIASALP